MIRNKKMKKIIGFGFLFILGFMYSSSAVTITPNGNGSDLVNNILGSGITVSNIVYNGNAVASGTFTDGNASGIGIESGIVLTTGDASTFGGKHKQLRRLHRQICRIPETLT